MEATPGSFGSIQADKDNEGVIVWIKPEAELMGILKEGKRRCKPCGKGFNNRASCIRHIAYAHKLIRFKCDRCNTDFSTMWWLKNHKSNNSCKFPTSEDIIKGDPEEQKVARQPVPPVPPREPPKPILNRGTHKCEICGKKFTNKWNVIRHKSNFHQRVLFKCEQCSKIFTTTPEFQRHQSEYCKFRIRNPHKNSTLAQDSANKTKDQCSDIDIGAVKVEPWIPETISDFNDGGASFVKLEENKPSWQLGQGTSMTQLDIKPYPNAPLDGSQLPSQFHFEPEESPGSQSTTDVKIEDPLFDVS